MVPLRLAGVEATCEGNPLVGSDVERKTFSLCAPYGAHWNHSWLCSENHMVPVIKTRDSCMPGKCLHSLWSYSNPQGRLKNISTHHFLEQV